MDCIERAKTIKVGDTCRLSGFNGIVEGVKRHGDSTYIKVNLDGTPLEIYGQYNHGWYGCKNEFFNY